MENRHKILLVDDDPDLLALYQEVLSGLPGDPEILTTDSGARAVTMLEEQPFRLLITDLKMPRMDGLQLLSVVRRKHPNLRTIVLTSVVDEQFRSRVYALGVDLFWQKPGTESEFEMFKETVASLVEREDQEGFRGMQSKSLVDIIQLECLSQGSPVLRITNGPLVGKIWITAGELIDAEAGHLTGVEAFQHVLSWKAGSFEVLSPEPDRPRTINVPYNALLLESAQAIDEASASKGSRRNTGNDPLGTMEGLDFFIALRPDSSTPVETRNIENVERFVALTRNALERFQVLGDHLNVGSPDTIVGLNPLRNIGMTTQGEVEFCIGWEPSVGAAPEVRDATKKASALWAS